MAYLVRSKGSSDKFWSVKIDGSKTYVSYGKIGTKGQQQEKDHGTAEKAKQAAEKLIKEKKKKGYEEGDGAEKRKKAIGKKRQSREDSEEDGSGSGEGSDEDGDDDDEPKPKRSARELAAAEKLEAVVRAKLVPHRSHLLRDLQALAACPAWKKASKVLFEIQADGLQHPGFPVEPFLHDEDDNEIPHEMTLLKDLQTLLPGEELTKIFPEDIAEEVRSGEGSFEIQSKAVAMWLADCVRELLTSLQKLHGKKPRILIALHDDEKALDVASMRWRTMD